MTIRARITIWYALVLAVTLAIAGAITYAAVAPADRARERRVDVVDGAHARGGTGRMKRANRKRAVLEVHSANGIADRVPRPPNGLASC